MSGSDSLGAWMGEGGDAAGLEAEAALARLRRGMFSVAEATVSLGRYRELEEIGRGGMSVVYRGRDESIGRWVAIKLLRGDHSEHEQRLRREARAMARLSHPNVVQVLEVGRQRDETYVVMELVEGADAAAWLAAGPRSWREVLDVFLAAGQGLVAAHGEDLVHRDFKPSNVMVGDDGRVRVTDFGLAASMGLGPGGDTTPGEHGLADGPGDDALTATGARLGTPRYMAPEQRFGASVDHRADQWSFAASLWESLYGQHPFADADGRLRPAQPTPTRPSSERGVPRGVQRVLRRALAIEPPQRHASMHDLLWQLRTAARARGRTVVAGVAALAVLGAATWWAAGASQPRPRCDPAEHSAALWSADRRAAVEQAFLATKLPFAAQAYADVDARLGPWRQAWDAEYRTVCEAASVEQGPDPEAERHLSCLRAELAEVEGLLEVFGAADLDVVGRAEVATRELPGLQRCVTPAARASIERGVLAEHEERVAAIRAQVRAGRYREAAALSEQAVASTTEPALRAEVALLLGENRRRSGDVAGAVEPTERAFYDAAAAEDARLATQAALSRLMLSIKRSEHDTALGWIRHAGTWLERIEDEPERIRLQRELGLGRSELLYEQGHYDDALSESQRVWDSCEGDESLPIVPRMFNLMGLITLGQGAYDDAASWYRRAVRLEAARSGREHPQVASSVENLGTVAWFQGDYEEAARRYEEAYAIRKVALGPNNPNTINTVMNLALIDEIRGDYEAAVLKHEQAVAGFEATLGHDHPRTAQAIGNLAVTLSEMGQWERSIALNRESLKIYEAALGPDHPAVGNALHNLASGLTDVERYEEALALHERALQIVHKANGREHTLYASGLHNIAVVLRRLDRYDEAEARDREALQRYEAAMGPDHPELAMVLVGLAQNALVTERWDDAVQMAERARALDAPSPSTRGLSASYLAQALWGAKRERDRVPELIEEARRELTAAGPNGEQNLQLLELWTADRDPGAQHLRRWNASND
ncbi:MAG: serine/threonine-protein kinase [Nannocystaceae bacterium]